MTWVELQGTEMGRMLVNLDNVLAVTVSTDGQTTLQVAGGMEIPLAEEYVAVTRKVRAAK